MQLQQQEQQEELCAHARACVGGRVLGRCSLDARATLCLSVYTRHARDGSTSRRTLVMKTKMKGIAPTDFGGEIDWEAELSEFTQV